jgi:hypothetical protein
MPVARRLLRPTRELERAVLNRPPIWSCTRWGLQSFPGHPENWCALTAPFHPYPVQRDGAVFFLLHFPSRFRDSMLWSTLPCGVRTFLWIVDGIQRSSGLLEPHAYIITSPAYFFVNNYFLIFLSFLHVNGILIYERYQAITLSSILFADNWDRT